MLMRKVIVVERHYMLPTHGVTDRPPIYSANTAARRVKI